MGSIDDIMQLCRLCLVKDQVNIPIFDETSDIRQTFLKINQCLPVKVSRDDNLPKKICDGCSYKLDMLYVFRNTSVDSEKQLISWLNQAGLGSCSLPQTIVKDGVTKPEIMVKQETFETAETRLESENPELNQELGVDTHSYIIQQQKLPYQQDFAAFGESSASTNLVSEEPPPKKAKRAAATKKQVPLETDEDALETAMQITKAEEEDSDDVDQPDYVEAPSTSAEDQPGPSGVGKGTIEAPAAAPLILVNRTQSRLYVCSICLKMYQNLSTLRSHQNVHKERKFQCPHCPKKFVMHALLKNHIMLIHENQRNYHCTFCEYAAKCKSSLDRHIITQHTQNYPYICGVCNQGFAYKSKFEQHKKIQHEGKRYVCPECSKKFRSKSHFEHHVKSHNADYVKKVLTCQVCSKVMHTTQNIKIHMQKHTGEYSNYVCEVCGKILTTYSNLMDHRIIHTKEVQCVCEVCGKGFGSTKFLKVHQKVHTKEKPFICELCDKTFAQKSSLTVHVRYHTGERPYKCERCQREFVSKTLLKSHRCRG